MAGDAAIESGPLLLGRRAERKALDELLEDARAGRGGALMLRGEAGAGKSALLEYLVGRASGFRVARSLGVESEMELAFAGVHQLCAPMLHRLGRLAPAHRDALDVAFALSSGPAPDPFRLGLAVLGLLSEIARETPLLCVVDDAHWLDHASAHALAFAARRLLAEPVLLVFAVREPSDQFEWDRLPALVVAGLGDADARALLESAVRGPLDARVRDRIVAETRGNPLALLELPRGASLDDLAGGYALPDTGSLSGRLEDSFSQRLARLPHETKRLLLIAAAEPLGEPVLLWRAGQRLGVGVEAAEAATAAGLAEFGGRVRFRHPLVRSAVYRSAPPGERQTVHLALAEVTDPDLDPDRRAWHRAHAAAGPDEDVAAELERSAGRALARGGMAAAGAFLERAAALTPDPARRAERVLAAADAKLHAGAFDAALELLARAQAGPLDEFQHARVDRLGAQIAFASRRGGEASALLLKAAQRLEPLSPALAREAYLEALSAEALLADFTGDGARAVAEATRRMPPAPAPRAADLLLEGLSLAITDGCVAGAPTLKRALDAIRGEELSRDQEVRWLWIAARVALELCQMEAVDALTARIIELGRQAGALTVLPAGLEMRALMLVLTGDVPAAETLVHEAAAVTEVTGTATPAYGTLMLAAWRGDEGAVSASIQAVIADAIARGEGLAMTASHVALAVLYNGLGRYEDAVAAAHEVTRHRRAIGSTVSPLVDLIEAAARTGGADLAADALERLAEAAQASGTDWALGVEARSRAVLSQGEAAERLYREAIERLVRSRVRAELARAHLLYGEWLRRERRHRDAREQLRTAHALFTAMGLEAFGERARRELLATGETVRKRRPEAREQLTAQELQVARLAGEGLSNVEIGGRLFISPRTVEYHLHKVFGKLGISSRHQLADAPSITSAAS